MPSSPLDTIKVIIVPFFLETPLIGSVPITTPSLTVDDASNLFSLAISNPESFKTFSASIILRLATLGTTTSFLLEILGIINSTDVIKTPSPTTIASKTQITLLIFLSSFVISSLIFSTLISSFFLASGITGITFVSSKSFSE